MMTFIVIGWISLFENDLYYCQTNPNYSCHCQIYLLNAVELCHHILNRPHKLLIRQIYVMGIYINATIEYFTDIKHLKT